MRCSSLYPPRWPTGVLWHGYVSTATPRAGAPAVTATHEVRRRGVGTSAAELARDCRDGDACAAVMQVRPLSASSGIAGSSPFGRSAFGPLGWL